MNTTNENYEMQAVRAALDGGADVNARDEWGDTVLHTYAAQGETDVVALLLAHGADVNARGDQGDTPLHRSAAQGMTETADLLLAHGADLNALDSFKYSVHMKEMENWADQMGCMGGDDASDLAFGRVEQERLTAPRTEVGRTAAMRAKQAGHAETAAFLEARSLAATLDAARPPESVPEPSAPVRLSNDPMDRAPREDLGAPDPKPIKPGRVRL